MLFEKRQFNLLIRNILVEAMKKASISHSYEMFIRDIWSNSNGKKMLDDAFIANSKIIGIVVNYKDISNSMTKLLEDSGNSKRLNEINDNFNTFFNYLKKNNIVLCNYKNIKENYVNSLQSEIDKKYRKYKIYFENKKPRKI